jgi:hypothetical protein
LLLSLYVYLTETDGESGETKRRHQLAEQARNRAADRKLRHAQKLLRQQRQRLGQQLDSSNSDESE